MSNFISINTGKVVESTVVPQPEKIEWLRIPQDATPLVRIVISQKEQQVKDLDDFNRGLLTWEDLAYRMIANIDESIAHLIENT